MEKKQYSLLHRLVIILMITLIPLQIIFYVSYSVSSRTVYEEISSSASSNVQYLQEKTTEIVNGVSAQIEVLFSSSTMTKVQTRKSFMTNGEYYLAMADALDFLNAVRAGNQYISDIRFYYVPLGRLIQTSYPSTKEIEPDEIQKRINAVYAGNAQLFLDDAALMQGRVSPALTNKSDFHPSYYAEVVFKNSEMQKLLSSFGQYSASNAFIVNNAGECVLCSDTCIPLSEANLEELHSCLLDADGVVRQTSILIDDEAYTAFYSSAPVLNYTFVQLVPDERLYRVSNIMVKYMLLFIPASVLSIGVYIIMVRRHVHRPLDQMLASFSSLAEGDFSARALPQSTDEFSRLASGFNGMVHQINDLMERDYRQKIHLQRMTLKHLQMQISPHFLYNSFFFLENMIDMGDSDSAKECLHHLAQFFQYINRSTDDFIALGEEVNHAKEYLAIQKMRFGKWLDTEVGTIPNEWKNVLTPRLILQPVVENAIKYSRADAQVDIIRISFREESGLLHILVQDNGRALTDEGIAVIKRKIQSPESTEDALPNIHRRLQLYYGKNSGLDARRSPLGGLELDITICSQISEG